MDKIKLLPSLKKTFFFLLFMFLFDYKYLGGLLLKKNRAMRETEACPTSFSPNSQPKYKQCARVFSCFTATGKLDPSKKQPRRGKGPSPSTS
jgi:hypothetical protein